MSRALAINLAVPHEPDLSWLLNKSAAAAGIKSNFGPLADAAAGGWGSGRNDPHEGRCRAFYDRRQARQVHPFLEAVGRERALYARWAKLEELHRAVLWCAYTEVRFPPQTDAKLGHLFGVAILTAAFREAYAEDEGTPSDWIIRACARSSRGGVVEAMRLQASALVEVAVRAWRETEPRARPHHVDEDTERRAGVAARAVEGPARAQEARAWVPDGAGRGEWMSAREGAEPCACVGDGRCIAPPAKRRRGECWMGERVEPLANAHRGVWGSLGPGPRVADLIADIVASPPGGSGIEGFREAVVAMLCCAADDGAGCVGGAARRAAAAFSKAKDGAV